MVAITKAAISSAALLALVQFSPAPFLEVPAIIITVDLGSAAAWVGAAAGVAGAITGGVAAGKGHKREEDPVEATVISRIERSKMRREAANQPIMNELAWKECKADVKKAHLHFSAAGKGNILVSGMPATCMTLATVITGKYNEGNPTPMSSSSIKFNNVSDKTIKEIQAALSARGAH